MYPKRCLYPSMFSFGLKSFSLQTSLGVIGIAWVGTLCTKYGTNAGLNEKRENVLATSEVTNKDQ